MADLVFRSTTRGGRDYFEVTDDGMIYGGKDRYTIKTDESTDYADTVDQVLAQLVFDGAWRVNYDKIEVDELGIGKEYLEIVKLIRKKYNYLYNAPKGSDKRQFYFEIGRYFKNGLTKGIDAEKIFKMIDDYIRSNSNLMESKSSNRKSIKEKKEGVFNYGDFEIAPLHLYGDELLYLKVYLKHTFVMNDIKSFMKDVSDLKNACENFFACKFDYYIDKGSGLAISISFVESKSSTN